ncbi:hypothetical protein [Ferrovibrio terrae]|uniref:hypothetical protein n=1 Tax=Ferrovibrio terrae TaxID=2594003 RepID=UPI003137E372
MTSSSEKILVVFCDNHPAAPGDPLRAKLLYAFLRRFLRPGFRHCFAVIPDRDGLTILDPRSDGLRVERLRGHGYLADLQFSADCGLLRLAVVARRAPDGNPRVGFYTCVGFITRLLGLPRMRPGPISPYQLYSELQRIECGEGAKHGRQAKSA